MDFATELEHGVTDVFQTAIYLESHCHFLRNSTGSSTTFDDRNRFGISGTSLELKYQLASPETSPVGVALYFEPAYRTIDGVAGDRIRERYGPLPWDPLLP